MIKITNLRPCLLLVSALFFSANTFSQLDFPVDSNDETGFISIFDGKSLDNWLGDPVYWNVKDGIMTGTVTPETLLKENSFIVWQGGTPRNFELKLEYRVSDKGNSGINYRSKYVETGLNNKFALSGYQCDIDGEGCCAGMNYEERGRTFLAMRGQTALIRTGEKPQIIGWIDSAESLWEESVKQNDWNEAHIIARDNVLIHIINGRVMSVVVDDDTEKRANSGYIGVQVHVGPPMTIEYKNIRLKELK